MPNFLLKELAKSLLNLMKKFTDKLQSNLKHAPRQHQSFFVSSVFIRRKNLQNFLSSYILSFTTDSTPLCLLRKAEKFRLWKTQPQHLSINLFLLCENFEMSERGVKFSSKKIEKAFWNDVCVDKLTARTRLNFILKAL